MSEFFSKPNPPIPLTPEQLTRKQRQAEQERIEREANRLRVAKVQEINLAARNLSVMLTSQRVPTDTILVGNRRPKTSGGILAWLSGVRPVNPYVQGEAEVIGRGWVIAQSDFAAEGDYQDGYSSSVHSGDEGVYTRYIILRTDGRIYWSMRSGLPEGTLETRGELDLLRTGPYADPGMSASDRKFGFIEIDQLERDLRDSGRRLLGLQ
jgi:hypothetical protein